MNNVCLFTRLNSKFFLWQTKTMLLSFIFQSLASEPPSPSAGAGSGSGGYYGRTCRFYINLACFSNELLLFRVLFLTFTLNPWRHKLFGRYTPRSSALATFSRWASGSNGASSSVRSRPSNSTGPNMNGLAIFAFSALSKLAGMCGSN